MALHLELSIQSHLSDALIEMEFNTELAHTRISFVKWLINRHRGDLTKPVDMDIEWEEYKSLTNMN